MKLKNFNATKLFSKQFETIFGKETTYGDISKEITSKDYYAPGSSWIQDQEEYNGAKAYSEFLRLFFKGKKEKDDKEKTD